MSIATICVCGWSIYCTGQAPNCAYIQKVISRDNIGEVPPSTDKERIQEHARALAAIDLSPGGMSEKTWKGVAEKYLDALTVKTGECRTYREALEYVEDNYEYTLNSEKQMQKSYDRIKEALDKYTKP